MRLIHTKTRLVAVSGAMTLALLGVAAVLPASAVPGGSSPAAPGLSGGHGSTALAAVVLNPAGNYTYDGSHSMTINAGGTWSLTLAAGDTDSGIWVQIGKSIALNVTANTVANGDAGCLLLGNLKTKTPTSTTIIGINTATKKGPLKCNNTTVGWYATKP